MSSICPVFSSQRELVGEDKNRANRPVNETLRSNAQKKKIQKNGAGFRLAFTFRNTLNFLGVITHYFESCAISLIISCICLLCIILLVLTISVVACQNGLSAFRFHPLSF